jgi:hypothetical protein
MPQNSIFWSIKTNKISPKLIVRDRDCTTFPKIDRSVIDHSRNSMIQTLRCVIKLSLLMFQVLDVIQFLFKEK